MPARVPSRYTAKKRAVIPAATLMRRWERARQGEGQLVLIVGEPGLGKSPLIEEYRGRLRHAPHTSVEWELFADAAKHAAAPDRRGAASTLVAPTYPPSSASQTWRIR
jgi:hypothetical protein